MCEPGLVRKAGTKSIKQGGSPYTTFIWSRGEQAEPKQVTSRVDGLCELRLSAQVKRCGRPRLQSQGCSYQNSMLVEQVPAPHAPQVLLWAESELHFRPSVKFLPV